MDPFLTIKKKRKISPPPILAPSVEESVQGIPFIYDW